MIKICIGKPLLNEYHLLLLIIIKCFAFAKTNVYTVFNVSGELKEFGKDNDPSSDDSLLKIRYNYI